MGSVAFVALAGSRETKQAKKEKQTQTQGNTKAKKKGEAEG